MWIADVDVYTQLTYGKVIFINVLRIWNKTGQLSVGDSTN